MTNSQLTLNDFIVQKVIGEGSYGRAVLCKQISNNKLVVIKEISLKKLTEQEQRDAWKETKVLSLLHHPNIIAYYGCFLQNNVLHIVMEYADNGDLSEEIRKSLNNNQHFDEDKILNWFVQICLALKHLHDRKILHRDLKNQNIFLLKDNTAKLGDFGIAKMLSSTSQMSNTAIGTPYYLSPEICQGKAYNMKSDIWSLGCILYELCTLHHPFDSNCLNGLIVKIQRAKPPPIPYYYSSSLRNLVDKLLQKVPAKRPSINQILELDFIRCRVPNFLSYAIERKEFCHTILHDFKPGESPEKAKVTPEDVENNNANLHYEKDDNQNNKGNRNRVSSRNRNNRQNVHRNIPRYSSNRNINADNRRRNNKDDEIKSPRLQYRIQSSPQIQQQPILSDFDQKSEEESVKSQNENEKYLYADESSNENDNDSYHSNQNFNYDNKNNQRNGVIRRRRNNDNQMNSPYISPMRNLQAKKNAAVVADRAMVRELRERKAIEDRITQLKNEEKRREVQEKAKERELQRKEQMRRLKQEEKERQEKYKKLKPTFKIDRKVHYHNNTDSESNDSNYNSNSDFENDERRERIKKRKEEEMKKENLRKNAVAIAEKMKNNQLTNVDSTFDENENDLNPNRKRENNISALREFLNQKRSEIRKNKQEDVIMIGNMKYYVNNSNDSNSNDKIEDSNKNENNEKENNKKQIENEVYGLIFDNYKNNEVKIDQNKDIKNSDEITKTEIENNIESYSSGPLTSDSNISSPLKNDSLLSNNSNQNNDILNTEESSYLTSSFESNNDESKSIPNPSNININNNANPSILSFNSPSSFKENADQNQPFTSESERSNSDFNSPTQANSIKSLNTNDKDDNILYGYKKVSYNSKSEYESNSPTQTNSIKSPNSDCEYSPLHYYEKVQSSSSNYDYSPLKSNDSEEAELKSPVSSSPIVENKENENEKGLKISDRQTTSVSDGCCVYSPMKALIENAKANEENQNQKVNNYENSAVNHKNTIILKIDKFLNDSFSNSGVVEEEETKNNKSFSPLKTAKNEEDQNAEIHISINDDEENKTKKKNSDEILSSDSSPRRSFFSNNYNFTFKGTELKFDNIKSNDSLAYKIETVRKFIEDSLGIEKTIEAYRLAVEDNFSNYKEILATPDQQSFYPLIMQLVSSEEILLAKWLK